MRTPSAFGNRKAGAARRGSILTRKVSGPVRPRHTAAALLGGTDPLLCVPGFISAQRWRPGVL